MRLHSLIVCLLIALGFVSAHAQTSTESSTATSSSLTDGQTKPAVSQVNGYRDFKFGMTVPELVAVITKVCERVDDSQASDGTVFGDACYEMAGKKRDLQFRVSSPPGSTNNEVREKILDLIVVEAGPYRKEYLQALDKSLSKKYQKTVQMRKDDIQQVKKGSKYRTGNLYANDQVALVLQHDKAQEVMTEKGLKKTPECLCIVMYYCTPELARTLHSGLKKPK